MIIFLAGVGCMKRKVRKVEESTVGRKKPGEVVVTDPAPLVGSDGKGRRNRGLMLKRGRDRSGVF